MDLVPSQHATVFFSNISERGTRSENFMRAQAGQYDLIAFAETHLRSHMLDDMVSNMSKDGWKVTATPSVLTGRSTEGSTGGEAIL